MAFNVPASLTRSLEATKVRYVRLGDSGLKVSFPILGAMSMGEAGKAGGWVLGEEASHEVLRAAYDCGLNTWDTADTYSNGLSEAVIGSAIRKFGMDRSKLVLMTKCHHYVGDEPDVIGTMYPDRYARSKDYVNRGGLSRSNIFRAVEASLRRLGTDYIDVYQIHRFDDETPPEETMRALHDLVTSGKVRYLGASSMWATQFATLQFVAERNGWTKFVSMQNHYNPCYREEEREMMRFCKATGVGLVPWRPLYGGKLCRALESDPATLSARARLTTPFSAPLSPAEEAIIRRVQEVAERKGAEGWNMSHVTLAWHRAKGTVPVVGFNSAARVEDMWGLGDKVLTEEEVRYIDEPYVAREIIGHS